MVRRTPDRAGLGHRAAEADQRVAAAALVERELDRARAGADHPLAVVEQVPGAVVRGDEREIEGVADLIALDVEQRADAELAELRAEADRAEDEVVVREAGLTVVVEVAVLDRGRDQVRGSVPLEP